MIHLVDQLVRRHLVRAIQGLTVNEVRFDPPNAAWRQQVGVGSRVMLNVYLVGLRENRTLRSSDVTRRLAGTSAAGQVAPLRVDCHYLISAHAPGAAGPALEPTLQEHQLLSEVIAAFSEAEPLSFERVFNGMALPAGLPPQVVGMALPFKLLPPEGWPKLEELWSSMGDGAVHKPAVYLVVTVPFLKTEMPLGNVVTTVAMSYHAGGLGAEALHTFGGRVADSANLDANGNPSSVQEAWVELVTTTGRRISLTRTDTSGAFTFTHLAAGTYGLRVTDQHLGFQVREIVIPPISPSYDVVY